MKGHVLRDVFIALVASAVVESCSEGEFQNSTRFGKDFIIGLFPNGWTSNSLGEFGLIIQTDAPLGSSGVVMRPALSGSFAFEVDVMPRRFRLTLTPSSTVSRTTGLHTGLLQVTSEKDIRILAYSGSYEESSYGGSADIPEKYLGNEYFVVVRVDPGLGQLVISSTGEETLVVAKMRAPFEYDGINYTADQILVVEVPTWSQMVITTSSNDLTGSRIVANWPVSVTSGSSCAFSPGSTSGSCDYITEQLVPYDKWGTSFYVPPFFNTSVGYFLQVIAGRDHTNVTIQNLVMSLNQGEVHDIHMDENIMLQVTSNKPVQVVQYLKEAPSMVTIPPEEQYTTRDTFIRTTGGDLEWFSFSHYFTIVVPCSAQTGINVTGTAVDINGWSVVHPTFSTSTSGMCALGYQGTEAYTYVINQSNPTGPFFVVVYGKSNTAGFAYGGGQQYQRLRCIDYESVLDDLLNQYSNGTTDMETFTTPTLRTTSEQLTAISEWHETTPLTTIQQQLTLVGTSGTTSAANQPPTVTLESDNTTHSSTSQQRSSTSELDETPSTTSQQQSSTSELDETTASATGQQRSSTSELKETTPPTTSQQRSSTSELEETTLSTTSQQRSSTSELEEPTLSTTSQQRSSTLELDETTPSTTSQQRSSTSESGEAFSNNRITIRNAYFKMTHHENADVASDTLPPQTEHAHSFIMCAQLCTATTSCTYFVYILDTKMCTLGDNVLQNLSVLAGAKVFQLQPA